MEKDPSEGSLNLYFFLMREKMTNFALAKNR